MEENKKIILKIDEISKSFPGVVALNKVSFEIYRGEVLAIVGENGAGKSTLIKILSGIYKQDNGKIIYKNEQLKINNPREAQELGISTIHQELNLLLNLTVGQNIFLNREPLLGGIFKLFKLINYKKIYSNSCIYLKMLGAEDIDVKTKVSNLNVAKRQIVEIAKALSIKSEVIIMDEPTSALSPKEIDKLFSVVKELKNKGVTFIFITHKLEEVFKIAERIVVLRDGKMIEKFYSKQVDIDKVINAMVGRDLSNLYPKTNIPTNNKVFEVKHLNAGKEVRNINFYLKKGEILGFTGLVGAGKSEIARTIFGVRKKTSGEIFVEGKKIEINTPINALKHGIGYVSENRKEEGLVLNMNVQDNICLVVLKSLAMSMFLKFKKMKEISDESVKKLDIKTWGLSQKVAFLSGGNQQKIAITKWLLANIKVLILDEPTRGIDVGAKAEVHSIISDIVKEGLGVILISAEMPEILGMCDRILIINNGEIKGELLQKEANQEKIFSIITQ